MNLLKGTWIFLTMLAIWLLINHACAQTAKVVELTKDEQATATKLYADKLEAEKAWADFHQHINNKYLKGAALQLTLPVGANPIYLTKAGWDWGFDFSEDLRFIVPKAPPTFQPSCTPLTHVSPSSFDSGVPTK